MQYLEDVESNYIKHFKAAEDIVTYGEVGELSKTKDDSTATKVREVVKYKQDQGSNSNEPTDRNTEEK